MMCTPDLYYQEFKIQDNELKRYKHEFLKRLDSYYDLIHDEKEQANVGEIDFEANKIQSWDRGVFHPGCGGLEYSYVCALDSLC